MTEGQIISIDYAKEGKKPWKFTVEDTEGETFQVATYDAYFTHELVGATVRFEREKNQYGYFTKQVDVVDEETPSSTKPTKKTTNKKTGSYKKPRLVKNTKPSTREDYRKEAEEATKKNLETAIKLAEELDIEWRKDVQGLVALTDLAARTQTTLFLNATKGNT